MRQSLIIASIVTTMLIPCLSSSGEKEDLSAQISYITSKVAEANTHFKGLAHGYQVVIDDLQRDLSVKRQRLQQVLAEEAKRKEREEKNE